MFRYEGRIVQQLIKNAGGSGEYKEVPLPALGIWDALLEVLSPAQCHRHAFCVVLNAVFHACSCAIRASGEEPELPQTSLPLLSSNSSSWTALYSGLDCWFSEARPPVHRAKQTRLGCSWGMRESEHRWMALISTSSGLQIMAYRMVSRQYLWQTLRQ